MIQTYPNLKVIDLDGRVWYFTEFLPDIQPYFYKFNITIKNEIESIFKFKTENEKNVVNEI